MIVDGFVFDFNIVFTLGSKFNEESKSASSGISSWLVEGNINLEGSWSKFNSIGLRKVSREVESEGNESRITSRARNGTFIDTIRLFDKNNFLRNDLLECK